MAISVWEHVNHILQHQTSDYYTLLEDADRKTFNVYMINRFISMNQDYILTVNELQKYYGSIPDKHVYTLYRTVFPRRKVFSKYVKADKTERYDEWMVSIITQEYLVSRSEATTYLDILFKTDAGKDELRSICRGRGIDDKFIKKIK